MVIANNKFDNIFKAINSGKTILGFYSSLKENVDKIIYCANRYKVPIVIKAARSLIECERLGGGDLGTTEDFAKYIKERDVGNYILLSRGWHTENNNDLEEWEIDYRRNVSFEADIKNGFELLYLRVEKKRESRYEEVVNKLIYFLENCEALAREYKKDIIYEIDVHNLFSDNKFDSKTFEAFLESMCGNMLFPAAAKFIAGESYFNIEKALPICLRNGFYLDYNEFDHVFSGQLQKESKKALSRVHVNTFYLMSDDYNNIEKIIRNNLKHYGWKV